jgi:ABC-type bacteriocin/lantibiotic exporter with double-glycine peptidase domain
MLAGSGGVARIVTISLLLQLFALASPILTGMVVDRVVPRGDTRLLDLVVIGLASLVVFQTLAGIVRAHLLLQMRTNLDLRLVLGFLDHLVSLPYAFFQRRSGGDLLMRVSSNQVIREVLSSQALSALIDGGLVLLYLVLIVTADVVMAAVVVGAGVLQILVLVVARPRILEQEARGLEARTRAQSQLVQLLSGIATLKLAGAERDAVRGYSQELAGSLDADLAMGRANALVEALLAGLRTSAPMFLLALGAHRVLAGEMTLGTMLAVNALAGAFLGPFGNLVTSVLALQRVRTHLERIEDVTSVAPEQGDDVAEAPRLAGELALERVSFRYAEGGPRVLDDVSLTIPAGASVAIVGPSGSGKTTLAALLLGLYPPSEGRVLVDGRDLRTLDLTGVRPQLGTVPQSPFFFDGSIRSNIALGEPDAPLDRVVAAARAACIHDDIAAMPMGYETLVADRGQSLSGGQRQRLALARALLRRPAALVLDEATSALDTETEARVVGELRRLRMTRVAIAHRLSTVLDADLIVVLVDGRIVETGRHEQLVRRGGRYAALVAAQLEGRR